MSMTNPVARLRIARDRRKAEAALDGALLKQTGLLATLILAHRETASEPFLDQAELMRLVKSQQSLLSASGEHCRACQPKAPKSIQSPALNGARQAFTSKRMAA